MSKQAFFLAGVLALATPVFAQDPAPTAAASQANNPLDLVGHLKQLFQMPFECDLGLQAKGDESVAGNGHFSWGGPGMCAANFTIAGIMDGEDLTMKLVADGKYVYMEVPTPMGAQVMKLSIDLLKKPETMSGLGIEGVDPGGVGETINKMNFKEEVKDGVRHLSSEMDSSMFGGDGSDKLNMALSLDEKTWFPQMVSITSVGGDADGHSVQLTTSNVKFPESLPAERFQYTAPEGAMVRDLGMLMGGGAEAEGEEEF